MSSATSSSSSSQPLPNTYEHNPPSVDDPREAKRQKVSHSAPVSPSWEEDHRPAFAGKCLSEMKAHMTASGAMIDDDDELTTTEEILSSADEPSSSDDDSSMDPDYPGDLTAGLKKSCPELLVRLEKAADTSSVESIFSCLLFEEESESGLSTAQRERLLVEINYVARGDADLLNHCLDTLLVEIENSSLSDFLSVDGKPEFLSPLGQFFDYLDELDQKEIEQFLRSIESREAAIILTAAERGFCEPCKISYDTARCLLDTFIDGDQDALDFDFTAYALIRSLREQDVDDQPELVDILIDGCDGNIGQVWDLLFSYRKGYLETAEGDENPFSFPVELNRFFEWMATEELNSFLDFAVELPVDTGHGQICAHLAEVLDTAFEEGVPEDLTATESKILAQLIERLDEAVEDELIVGKYCNEVAKMPLEAQVITVRHFAEPVGDSGIKAETRTELLRIIAENLVEEESFRKESFPKLSDAERSAFYAIVSQNKALEDYLVDLQPYVPSGRGCAIL